MAAGTPAMVQLVRAAVVYTAHEFDHDPSERSYGLAAARAIGVDADRVFKTLLADVTDARIGDLVTATVTGTDGVDLIAHVDGAGR